MITPFFGFNPPKEDYELLYRYYRDKVSQKELVLESHITQQAVSRD